MPLFGSKKKSKAAEAGCGYPVQKSVPPPPPGLTHPIQPQQGFPQGCYQSAMPVGTAPGTQVVHVMMPDFETRAERFLGDILDGPDYTNKVRDPRIPPPPGSFFITTVAAGPSGSHLPPQPLQHPHSAPAYTEEKPPSYDETFSEEKKRL